MANNLS